MSLLHLGDTFPELTLTIPGGKTVTVPMAFAGRFSVVLFYRGAWCLYCNAQLRAFQGASATRSMPVDVAGVYLGQRFRNAERDERPADDAPWADPRSPLGSAGFAQPRCG